MTKSIMNAEELDTYLDNGGDSTEFIVPGTLEQPNKGRKIHLVMPSWMVNHLDAEATHLGITRQAMINVIIAHHFDSKE